jgi:hypothetical protein
MKRWIPVVLFLLGPVSAPAQETPLRCTDKDADYRTCFNRLLNESLGRTAPAEVAEDVAAKATPEESPEAATGLRTFLPNFLGALGLGDLSEDDGTLTFTFNPELLSRGPHQLSLQTVLRESAVFDPLVQALPADIREERRGSLGEGLDQDFGDVEASLTWTLENERFGRDYREHSTVISSLYAQLVTRAAGASGTGASQAFLQLLSRFPNIPLENRPVGEIRSQNPEQASLFERALVEAVTEISQRQLTLVGLTDRTGFFHLADLINNQPQIHVTAAYHSRDDLVGQDEWSIDGTFEMSFHNFNRWEKSCGLKADIDCLEKYINENRNALKFSPRLTFSAEFGRLSAYDFALPADDFVFHLDEIETRIATLTYGQYLSLDKEGNQDTRLDLEAKYEDVTGDPLRNQRFVSTLTLTQRLPNNTSAAVTLVYADKPKYLGEVDEELSARVGLRFKIDPIQP